MTEFERLILAAIQDLASAVRENTSHADRILAYWAESSARDAEQHVWARAYYDDFVARRATSTTLSATIDKLRVELAKLRAEVDK